MRRQHVVLLDRSGYDAYRHPDGRPYLDPEQYDVTLVTLPEKADGPRPGEVARVITVNVLDPVEIMDALPELKAGPPVDRVVAAGERLLVPAARFREALGVPGYREEQIELFRDKTLMKSHFAAQGIRTPRFTEIERPLDAAGLLAEYGTVILKPVDAMGSVGVHKVTSRDQLAELEESGFGHQGRYEAEEFIDGVMYHIDSVVQDGRAVVAVASRYLDPNSVFPTGGQLRSAALNPGRERDVLLEFNSRVLAAVPWFSGVTHHEVFLDRSGTPVFCEIAGRPGGGGIVPLFKDRFGINLYLATLLPQLGLPIPEIQEIQPPERRFGGWSIIFPPELGPLRPHHPLPQEDWLLDLTLYRRPGDVLEAARSVGNGVAAVAVVGPDAATVTERLDRVKAAFTFDQAPSATTPTHEGETR
ncbi:acetyl-CoA carboxylase biotin carboxylase subunit family protein [Kitasatospora sp. NBC_00315]|uniref:ATP-grasp domain-containing protein n=1 Tax=Kitasatospora sp. NBC_00315 TaxID=2975963 RepID=UPI00324302A6